MSFPELEGGWQGRGWGGRGVQGLRGVQRTENIFPFSLYMFLKNIQLPVNYNKKIHIESERIWKFIFTETRKSLLKIEVFPVFIVR